MTSDVELIENLDGLVHGGVRIFTFVSVCYSAFVF